MLSRMTQVLVLGSVLWATPFVTPEAVAQKSKDELRFGFSLSLSTIDPYFPRGREIVMVVGELLFDTLMYRDPATFEHKPLLATSWTWIDDTTLEMTLRQDVKWHDGQPFTAEDVKYTFDYITDPKNKIYRPDQSDWIASTDILGPHKARLHLKKPFGPAVEYLTQVLPILPKDFFGPGGVAGGNGRLVGTGPYRLVSFAPEKEAKFAINRDYFAGSAKGTPSIGKLHFRNFPDQATQIAELISGGIDWMWRVEPEYVEKLAATPGISVTSGGTMRTYWMSFDSEGKSGKPFMDRRVRRAVAHAVDRATLTRELAGPGSQVLEVPCYPAQLGCPRASTVTPYDYDPAKAKALLEEAGYGKGFDTTLYFYHQGYNRNLAQAIQGYLRQVGVRTSLEETTVKVFFEKVEQGKVPVTMQSFGQWNINDVAIILPVWFGGGNRDVTNDPQLRAWLDEAGAILDPERRTALYNKAGQRIVDEVYWFPLFSQAIDYAFSSDLDFTAWPDENPRFYMSKWK